MTKDQRHISWESVVAMALKDSKDVRPPKILKIDIEGWELNVLRNLLHSDNRRLLPQQIAVEVHLRTHVRYNVPGFKNGVLQNGTAALVNLVRGLESAWA